MSDAGGGGPMTKPVGGIGWQSPNKPAAALLDERIPELRRPPSLSIGSPLRARRRSVVSVLTGENLDKAPHIVLLSILPSDAL